MLLPGTNAEDGLEYSEGNTLLSLSTLLLLCSRICMYMQHTHTHTLFHDHRHPILAMPILKPAFIILSHTYSVTKKTLL